jgi:hypothetical protein
LLNLDNYNDEGEVIDNCLGKNNDCIIKISLGLTSDSVEIRVKSKRPVHSSIFI